jgi:hypothetical protein
MKTKILYRLVLVAAFLGVLFACNKNNDKNNSSTMSDADLQTQSDDQTRVSNETDAAFDDINTVMNDQATVTGSRDVPAVRYGVITTGVDTIKKMLICDAVLTVDTSSNTRKLTINYNGSGCGIFRKRTGTIVISITKGVRWQDKGAQVNVDFNLKVVRVADNKSLSFTGRHVYTNVSGGSLANLTANSTPVTHSITSDNMVITFDNGAQRTWNIGRQRTYSYDGGLVIATNGTHNDGTTSNISDWGENRFGNSFSTVVMKPLLIKQSCSWQLTGGEVALMNAAGTTDITFGLDATGASTGCPVSGAFYYLKLVYSGKAGKTYTFISPY